MTQNGAAIWEEPITIPTYRIGPPEQNPIFYAGRLYQGAKGPIYPYPMLDKLTDDRRDRTYKSVNLENECIKVTVLPEIGGRILAGLDKTNGYDFFYRQSVIKPALIGMVGAWISGGVEWNVPHHHRPSTFMPVDYVLRENADGSKTVWVGETERRHRMKWLVGMTVFPGRSYLKVTAKIMNRTALAHSMLYFTNAAVKVNPCYQVIFPPDVEYGTQHAKCDFVQWPIADGTYAGVDYRGGVDVSFWKNHPHWLSIFVLESEKDFFGGYDHSRAAGVAHVADHHVFPGKKFFTFSGGPGGRTWDKILTDTDGPYLELMAGAYSDNQPDYSWIEPRETRVATEYWYPIRELGGIKNANMDAAVNLDVDGRGVARLALNATTRFDDATVLVRAGDKMLFEERALVSPEKPFFRELTLPAGLVPESLQVSLMSSSGREVISYRPVKPKGAARPEPVAPPPAPEKIQTNEELYLAGLRIEQFHNSVVEPYPYYEEALKRDAGDCRANTALAILYLKRGMFAEAQVRLRAAAGRVTKDYTRPKDGEAYYYLGVALAAEGKYAEARDAFERAAWSFAWRAASYHALAEICMVEGDFAEALVKIEQGLSFNAFDVRGLDLKAAILRKMGRFEEAVRISSEATAIDMLDFCARNERWLALSALGRKEAGGELDELGKLMRDDAESYLELASDYAACGLFEEASDVLVRLVGGREDARVDPMVHYTLGFYWEKRGDGEKAARHYALGKRMPPNYCFPFRLESIAVLESAMKHDATDSRAPYYLGNLLYDFQPERAVRAWERSRELDDTFPTVHRNLGFAYARVEKDYAKAIASYKKAIERDPNDALLLAELDPIMAAAGVAHEERLALFRKHHETALRRDDALLREIMLYILVGQYDRAIELMAERHFHIWEGGETNVHDLYVDAHLLRGRKRLNEGRRLEALADFEAASEYPERFELGRPYDGGRDAEVYYLVGTAFDTLGRREKAETSFKKALEKDKRGTFLAYYQGLARRRLGQEDKATALFEDAIEVGKKMLSGGAELDFFGKFGGHESESVRQSQGRYLVGLGLSGKGDLRRARREFEKALALNINHLGAQTMLAELTASSGTAGS